MTKTGLSFEKTAKGGMIVDTVNEGASEQTKVLYRNGMLSPKDVRVMHFPI